MSNLAISKEHLERVKPSFLEQSGLKESDFKREVSFAMQLASANPYLQQCTPDSALKAVLNIAQVGLTLNPVKKEAYLVPRWNSKLQQNEVCLDPSYMGLIKLATDSGIVKSINCQLIYSGDEIEIDLSQDNPITKHTPYILTGKPKGSIIGSYSVATLRDGSKHAELMGREEIESIRERSEGYKAFKAGKTKSNVWISDEGEMFRKTVIKRHCKYLPKSGDKLYKAIEVSNYATGFDETLSHSLWAYVESKLESSTLDEPRKQAMRTELENFSYKWEADKMLEYIEQYQPKSLNEQFKDATND
jgi:recombination protein RecT